MAKEQKIEVDGLVIEALPNSEFKVKLDGNDHEIRASISGKIRINNICQFIKECHQFSKLFGFLR